VSRAHGPPCSVRRPPRRGADERPRATGGSRTRAASMARSHATTNTSAATLPGPDSNRRHTALEAITISCGPANRTRSEDGFLRCSTKLSYRASAHEESNLTSLGYQPSARTTVLCAETSRRSGRRRSGAWPDRLVDLIDSRDGRIRTDSLLVPNEARYQVSLHPERPSASSCPHGNSNSDLRIERPSNSPLFDAGSKTTAGLAPAYALLQSAT
jgi:hypothetical protein